MKKMVIILLTGMFISCNSVLKNVSTEGLTYVDEVVYYKGQVCATLSGIEIASDDGKIVREATFVLTSPEYNPQALGIIKLISSKHPDLEVEVELKSKNLK